MLVEYLSVLIISLPKPIFVDSLFKKNKLIGRYQVASQSYRLSYTPLIRNTSLAIKKTAPNKGKGARECLKATARNKFTPFLYNK